MNDHEFYMRRAISLAANVPDLPFGALIVDGDSGTILSEGWNKTSLNPIWHGEIDAINGLAASGGGVEGKNLVLYTTAEPCPMCQGAILWTGIKTVVFGTCIRSLQRLGWRQINILAEEIVRRSPAWNCTLIGGVLEQDCDDLFQRAMLQRAASSDVVSVKSSGDSVE
ncbi:MAG: nucleoside deaminase [Planctomycetota bacterium]|nr:nucleoside deaminase [Planctomycetota bacterium]